MACRDNEHNYTLIDGQVMDENGLRHAPIAFCTKCGDTKEIKVSDE